MTLTVRSATVTGATTKGSALTHAELDENFNHLRQSTNHTFTQSGSGAVSGLTVQGQLQKFGFLSDFDTAANFNTFRDALTGTMAVPSLHVDGDFTSAAGTKYAIGATTVNNGIQFMITGDFTGETNAYRMSLGGGGGLTVPANGEGAIIDISGATINSAASGSHQDFVGLLVADLTCSINVAAVNNASLLKLGGAATGATNNYGLWLSGTSAAHRMDGQLRFREGTGGGRIFSSADGFLDILTGSTALRFYDAAGNNERMRLTDGGQLQLGDGSAGAPAYSFSADTNTGIYRRAAELLSVSFGGTVGAELIDSVTYSTAGGLRLHPSAFLSWSVAGGDATGGGALFLSQDAANTLAQRNGTTAQEQRLYARYTSATDYGRRVVKWATTTLSAVSGASVTATGLIPARAQMLDGVISKVVTALGTTNSTTGYAVGTSGDPNLWGDVTGTATTTASGSANFTASPNLAFSTSAQDVVVTAAGGNFDGTGAIYLAVPYSMSEAD